MELKIPNYVFFLDIEGLIDYRQKCQELLPLHQRVSPIFYGVSCSNTLLISSILAQWGFTTIHLLFSSIALAIFLFQKENIVFGNYGPSSYFKGFDPEEQAKIAEQHKKLKKLRLFIWTFFFLFAVASITALCYFLFRGLGGQIEGVCPTDRNYFYDQAWKSDLECCEWRNSGSCAKPGSICDKNQTITLVLAIKLTLVMIFLD